MATRFLIISDTHGQDIWHERQQEPPKADVLLHCGDLSSIGGMSEYRTTMNMLKKVDAELKLVIAGNHDVSLDKDWWQGENLDEDDDPDMPQKARDFWTGKDAVDAGVTFLDEGLHSFRLRSGVAFKIWVTPFTPAFGGYAFAYGEDEDRFASIPDEGVDILMTHGPPYQHLDRTKRGENAGCQKLMQAIARSKPRLHCFGHVHEGYGAQIVSWDGEEGQVRSSDISHQDQTAAINATGLLTGKETLLVNAAMLDEANKPVNAPWLVDLQLPTSGA